MDDISARDVAAVEDATTANVTDSCCRELLMSVMSVLLIRCNVGKNATFEDGDNVGYGLMYSEKTAVALDSVDNVEFAGMTDPSIEFKDDCSPLTSVGSSGNSNVSSRKVDDNTTGVLTTGNVFELDAEGVTNSDEIPYSAVLVIDAPFNLDEIIE